LVERLVRKDFLRIRDPSRQQWTLPDRSRLTENHQGAKRVDSLRCQSLSLEMSSLVVAFDGHTLIEGVVVVATSSEVRFEARS
jgi:hypothetical protein